MCVIRCGKERKVNAVNLNIVTSNQIIGHWNVIGVHQQHCYAPDFVLVLQACAQLHWWAETRWLLPTSLIKEYVQQPANMTVNFHWGSLIYNSHYIFCIRKFQQLMTDSCIQYQKCLRWSQNLWNHEAGMPCIFFCFLRITHGTLPCTGSKQAWSQWEKNTFIQSQELLFNKITSDSSVKIFLFYKHRCRYSRKNLDTPLSVPLS